MCGGPLRPEARVQVLDCESFDSAARSCAELMRTTPAALLDRVRSFEYNDMPESERRAYPYEELFLRRTLGLSESDLPAPPAVMWFHATRVPDGTSFEEGLLPMSARLEHIWTFLGRLASDWSTPQEWKVFRKGMRGQGASQYALKVSSGLADGPFAFLVREMIFQPRLLGNHDYLGVPEIVEDICMSYEEMHGKPLRARFIERTRPCIVKFRASEPRPDTLAAALLYVHRKSRGEDLWTPCNTCFSGEGLAVPPTSILAVEWPQYEIEDP